MTRITIIGNSHVAALKQGWGLVAERFPGVELRFFAVPGPNLSSLKLGPGLRFGIPEDAEPNSEAYLSAERVNGCTWTDLADNDVVVRAGFGWPHRAIAELLIEYDIDEIRSSGAEGRMSLPCYRAVCRSIAESLLPAAEWRDWERPALAVIPRPVASENCLHHTNERHGRWSAAWRDGASFAPALDLFFEEFENVFEMNGILMVRRPEGTVAPSGLTMPDYSRGSVRLGRSQEHGEADSTHMNAKYGALCVERLLDRLGLQPEAPHGIRQETATSSA